MAARLSAELEKAVKIFNDARSQQQAAEAEIDLDDEEEDDNDERLRKASEKTMKRIVKVISEAYSEGLPDEELDSLLRRASEAESNILSWAYGNGSAGRAGGYNFYPVYSPGFIKDLSGGPNHEAAELMMDMFFGSFMGMGSRTRPSLLDAQTRLMNAFANGPVSYNADLKPSAHTTRLALFKKSPASLPGSDAAALALREARCEIQSQSIPNPIQLAVGGDAVAVISCGGWKERHPIHEIYKLGTAYQDFEDAYESSFDPGHLEVCTELAVDGSERHLVWSADGYRIKSMRYAFRGAQQKTIPRHTLDSKGYDGPIALLDEGARLFRAGDTGIGVWNVDEAPKHASKKDRIGGNISRQLVDNSPRALDDPYIERSKGTPPSTKIAFADGALKGLNIRQWTPDPSRPSSSMLCATGRGCKTYAVYRLDLETGRDTTRYLGHGAIVNKLSTTAKDQNVFLTSCNDGGTRLYDIRTALPSLTLFSAEEGVRSSVLISSGGGLYAFAGGSRSQQIKLWDIRGKAPLYELSTGNNMVQSLGWDETNTTLYAATESQGMDRLGYHHGYRSAKIPNWARGPKSEVDDEPEPEHSRSDSDDDGDDSGSEEVLYSGKIRAWPMEANHTEKSFGYAFDAGDHRLFRYAFKSDADPTILPEYGDAVPGEAENEFGMWG